MRNVIEAPSEVQSLNGRLTVREEHSVILLHRVALANEDIRCSSAAASLTIKQTSPGLHGAWYPTRIGLRASQEPTPAATRLCPALCSLSVRQHS